MNLKLLLIFFIILTFRFFFVHNNQPQYTDGQKISFKVRILSQPHIVGTRQAFSANYKNQKIRIVTSRFPEFNYGDFVRISGSISIKDARLLMYYPKIEEMKDDSVLLGKSLKVVKNLRQKLIDLFSRTLPSPSSSLLMGIIFGIKEQMPKDFAESLKTTGVFHVIAASGMNVTLIGGFISIFFAFLLKRQIAIGLSILGIIFYAVLAGLEASIIRASIMGIIVFSSQIMGRQSLAINGLALAGFAMLFIDPSLIFDIGFQLSFASTLGILYIKPLLTKKNIVGSEISTTVAAQTATLPILLANFGTYSIYSILVNGLVLWTVQILMVIGGIGALIALVFMPLGQLIIYLSYPLLLYFESIVRFFGKMGGIISIEALSFGFVAGYYCLLGSALIILKKK